jgi:hypothetical protein
MYLYHFNSFYIFGLQLSHFGVLFSSPPLCPLRSHPIDGQHPFPDWISPIFCSCGDFDNTPTSHFKVFSCLINIIQFSLFNLPMISHVNLPIHARFPVNPRLHLRISEAPHNLHRSACQRWHLSAHRVHYLGQQNGRGSVTWAMVGHGPFR